MTSTKPNAPIRTIRLCQADIEAVIAQMDANERGNPAQERRRHPRMPIMRPAVLKVDRGGAPCWYEVFVRNISEGGASVLHGTYTQALSTCCLTVLTPCRESLSIQGHIGRCVHVSGRVHELGLHFKEFDMSVFSGAADGRLWPRGSFRDAEAS